MATCVATSSLSCPAGTYYYTLARSHDTFGVIGSDDYLRLFDAKLSPLRAISRSHTGITCITTGPSSAFVTAGRDAAIRVWDQRTATAAAVLTDPQGNPVASIACHDNYLAAGNESAKEGLDDVSVMLYDLRNAKVPLRRYNESHTDTITQLAFHPSLPHVLLSGSTDGLVSFFDINHHDEEDALQQVLNPRSAVHCAGYLAQDQVYIVSTDEQFSIHTLPKTAAEDEVVPPPVDFGDVRAPLKCMYVVNVLVQPDGPPLMAYGHNENQTLSMVSLSSAGGSWKFDQAIELPGAHGEEVVRDVIIADKHAYTCGEDGVVRAWSLAR